MRRARFSITQKYNGGHNNRSHCTAIGRSGAKVTSFSSLSIALRISSAIRSGLAPAAVVESVTVVWKMPMNRLFSKDKIHGNGHYTHHHMHGPMR